MTNSRTLTLATLRKKGACPNQVALFRELFGDSVEITEELAAEHAGKFNVDWASEHLLSPPARAACSAEEAQAWDAYNAAKAPAWDAYYAATAQAWDAYNAAKAQAWDAYNAAKALAAYEAARAQAWAAYKAAIAQTWARAYINDGGKQ